jgi:hypothetical protein
VAVEDVALDSVEPTMAVVDEVEGGAEEKADHRRGEVIAPIPSSPTARKWNITYHSTSRQPYSIK